jgi:hypothetical protein
MKRAFSKVDWQAIGRAMAERRGLDWNEVARPAARAAKSLKHR